MCKTFFNIKLKTGLRFCHLLKEMVEKLVTEQELYLLLSQQGYDSILTPEDILVA